MDFTKSFVVHQALKGYRKGSANKDSRRPVSFSVSGVVLTSVEKVQVQALRGFCPGWPF